MATRLGADRDAADIPALPVPTATSGAKDAASVGKGETSNRGRSATGAIVGQGVGIFLTTGGRVALGVIGSVWSTEGSLFCSTRPTTFQPATTPRTLNAPRVTLWAVVTFFFFLDWLIVMLH
jgi:hypothetical protein